MTRTLKLELTRAQVTRIANALFNDSEQCLRLARHERFYKNDDDDYWADEAAKSRALATRIIEEWDATQTVKENA